MPSPFSESNQNEKCRLLSYRWSKTFGHGCNCGSYFVSESGEAAQTAPPLTTAWEVPADIEVLARHKCSLECRQAITLCRDSEGNQDLNECM